MTTPVIGQSAEGDSTPVDGTEPSPYGLPVMSLRDYFAGQALLFTLSASTSTDGTADYIGAAVSAYHVADAMLQERAR